jgi:hypothetical protein
MWTQDGGDKQGMYGGDEKYKQMLDGKPEGKRLSP